MESYTLPHLPHAHRAIHLALFEDVTNAPEIRKRLIAASTMEGTEGDQARRQVDYGFVEANLLVSKEHLLVATLTAVLAAFPSSPASASASSSSSSSSIASSTTPVEPLANLSLSSSPAQPPTAPATAATAATPTPTPRTRSHNLHSELLLYLSPNNNISDSIRRHGMSDSTTRLAIVHITSPDVGVEDVWRGIEGVVRGRLVGWGELDKGTDWGRVDKIYKLSELNALNDPNVKEKKINAVISTVAIKNVT